MRKPPVILAPGFLGFRDLGMLGDYWEGWRDALEQDGFAVFEHMPTPVATSARRAEDLMRTIQSVKRRTGAPKVIVIAHSQGGIDVREAIARGASEDIAAVATLSSPFRGTPLANAALQAFPMFVMGPGLTWLQRGWQAQNQQEFSSPDVQQAVTSLGPVGMAHLASLPTHGVPFFSFAALGGEDTQRTCEGAPIPSPVPRSSFTPISLIGNALIQTQGDIANDGVVATASMRFGRFVGCVAGDHAVWLGWNPFSRFDQRAFAVELARALSDVATSGEPASFDAHLPRFVGLAHPANSDN